MAYEPPADESSEELFDEELDADTEEFLRAWDQADRDAVEVLREALGEHCGRQAPAADVAAAAARAREQLHAGSSTLDWVRRGADLGRETVPEGDDLELLLRCVSTTISPHEETGLPSEEESLLITLEHADWLAAVLTAVRGGAGARVTPRLLAAAVHECPEVRVEDYDEFGDPFDDQPLTEAGFSIAVLPWMELGVLDRDERLTPLGEWLLPRALARAWNGEFDG